MKVIGIAGTNGAGKDAVANYICKRYGYKKITVGEIVREMMKEEKIRITRKSQGSYQKKYVKKHGMDYFMKKVIEKIKRGRKKKIVVSGLRYPTDVKTLKKAFKKKFFSLMVDSDPKIRYYRMTKRKRADMPRSYEHFQKQENREFQLFKFKQTFKLIDEIIMNNETFYDLKANIRKIIKKKRFA